MPTNPPAELAAALAGRYDLRRTLGQGGMATVYHAHDSRHQRSVALKVLLPGLAAHVGADRFLKEIRIAARLTHPRILPLYDSGEAAGFLYICHAVSTRPSAAPAARGRRPSDGTRCLGHRRTRRRGAQLRSSHGDSSPVIFFSVITAGILPMVFMSIAQSRKRRVRRFFRLGTPALAEVVDFREEDVGFGVKLTRVRYEFVADGETCRGSDLTLPVIADRWRAGDRIEILYLPGRNHDSVIATRH